MMFFYQSVQHIAGTQEGAHPQICCRELLFPHEKGDVLSIQRNLHRPAQGLFLDIFLKLKK